MSAGEKLRFGLFLFYVCVCMGLLFGGDTAFWGLCLIFLGFVCWFFHHVHAAPAPDAGPSWGGIPLRVVGG